MKNHLIVGGSSGIGAALTDILAEGENTVFATYNTNSSNSDSDKESYHFLDVSATNVELEFLPETIDGLAYCPGSINLKPFARSKPDEFIADFNIQVTGSNWITGQILHVDGGMSSIKN